ncbi:MAG: EF-P beta-lysylation protein EpmB [Methylococcaceae bacterium]|nr:EF-P beta-lysylation protein EpmB [Methylococcaceae bacterium]
MNPTLKTWQHELTEGFSNVKELCNYLDLTPSQYSILHSSEFPLRVPREFVERMEKGNIDDPLLKQILPIQDEEISFPGFNNDPVGDINAMTETGVIHKYQGRVLFITTGSCAINCRYCFRRNFPYSDFQLNTQKLERAIQYIKDNQDISEVILSGGDPLLLSDRKLFSLINRLDKIYHLKRIRIHSRIPVVLPSRITNDFCQFLSTVKKNIIFVIHSNHTNELNENVRSACQKIKKCNVTLLNQSVLLKGINDAANELVVLSEKLFSFDVLPYYLHMLDKASGTHHFEVDKKTAILLMDQIKKQLPGYLVPKLVNEQTGALNKIVIA